MGIFVFKNCNTSAIVVFASAGWTFAPARRPPMAGNFHGGQVKFDKYQPGWQALFPKFEQITEYGQVKDNFGLVTFVS